MKTHQPNSLGGELLVELAMNLGFVALEEDVLLLPREIVAEEGAEVDAPLCGDERKLRRLEVGEVRILCVEARSLERERDEALVSVEPKLRQPVRLSQRLRERLHGVFCEGADDLLSHPVTPTSQTQKLRGLILPRLSSRAPSACSARRRRSWGAPSRRVPGTRLRPCSARRPPRDPST